MNELIEQIKTIMIDVATGKANIQDTNDEYKRIFQELDDLFVANNMKNPNDFSDLWEFYNYWKKRGMKTYADRRSYIIKLYKNIKPKKPVVKLGAYNFVHPARIKELKALKNTDFDISKLVRFCEELNIAFSCECYLSTAMLVRAIADHIPPIFEKNTFTEVSNNHGSKSFKESMKNLDNSSRKISDSHLHTQIRKKEVLPNSNQVDFSNDLDVLLAEIYRVLK
ncbi:hypothetical protein COY87_02250 [Candidatus Roizmanbacteria bacterium CG_4_10_14_0_8_um_filter_33_9]|uniref:Uncharacterized protein n=1 Tax=Candidatus Roizmanbacteria bacterium CG_4_10_14_0_8_um_filter_33_9 TaxID=1974826 RepID=A0A2M7QK18_9BACT|nr:MAG: hypothetical protein COY87_02250 [Candidatus Roizmanbacteria bacterium CG_4_10_14_0_8_um_filter_33_9]